MGGRSKPEPFGDAFKYHDDSGRHTGRSSRPDSWGNTNYSDSGSQETGRTASRKPFGSNWPDKALGLKVAGPLGAIMLAAAVYIMYFDEDPSPKVFWLLSLPGISFVLELLPVDPTIRTLMLGSPVFVAALVGCLVSAVTILVRKERMRWLWISLAIMAAVSAVSFTLAWLF